MANAIVVPKSYTVFKNMVNPMVLEGFPVGPSSQDVRLQFTRNSCVEKTLDTTVSLCKGIANLDLDLGCDSDFRLPAGAFYSVSLGLKASETDIYHLLTFNLFVSDVL